MVLDLGCDISTYSHPYNIVAILILRYLVKNDDIVLSYFIVQSSIYSVLTEM